MYGENDDIACAVVGALFPHVGASMAAQIKAARARKDRVNQVREQGQRDAWGRGMQRGLQRGAGRFQRPPEDPAQSDPYTNQYGEPQPYALPPQYGGSQVPWFAEQPAYGGGGYGDYPQPADGGGYYDGAPEGSDY